MKAYELVIIGSATVAGIAVLLWIIDVYRRWRGASCWATIAAEVQYVGVRWKWLYTWPARTKNYLPDVRYAYSVNGRSYIGSAVTVRDESISSVDREEMLEFLKRVQSITVVRVNLLHPDDACLMPEITRRHWDFLLTYGLIGCILFGCGIGLLLVSINS